MRSLMFAVAGAGVLLGAGTLSAQTIAPSVIASGGTRATNGVVSITGTIGQPAIGPSTGSGQSAALGFWATAGSLLALPQITSVTPTAGITSGGTVVYVNGFNFAPGATVNFATGAANVVGVTQNRLTVITPAHAAGVVDVGVSLNAANMVKPAAYTYMDSGPGDTDGDGMPDACELHYSLDPLNPGDASADPDGDGKTNLEECLAGTNPHGFYKSYLAEGASNAFFQTRLALLNPGAAPATLVTEFLLADGTVLTNPSVLPSLTRATQDVETLPAAPVNDFSTLVESDFPLVVDRTMTWDGSGYGSHAETAVPAPAQDWYLAEGATHGRFDLFYLLQNPTSVPADVTVTYLRPGLPPIIKTYNVVANSRRTIWVDNEDPELAAVDVSASIHATQPIVVERSMYLTNPGQAFAGGTDAMGVTTIGPDWFLAEGATGSFFDMYVLIANPTMTDANVQVTYLLSSGQTVVKNYLVAAQSRYTISVSGEDPLLASAAISTIVHSTNGVSLAVERAMWWPSPGNWYEGHAAVGAQTTGTKWALADGEEGGSANKQTYVLIANTSAFAGSAKVTVLFEDGTSAEQTIPLPASSRVNVDIGAAFAQQTMGKRFGTIVESLGATPCQIVVERAMYSDANGVVWAAGTDALATKLH
jgi:hypothetical protein